jgi:hypothetical protein
MHSQKLRFFCFFRYLFVLSIGSLLIISSFWSCAKQGKVGKIDPALVLDYVFFAHPEGGIRAYSSQNKEIISITDALDYHPNMLKSGILYFLRYQKADQKGKFIHPVSLMSWNSQDLKVKKVKTLNSLPFNPELNNQIFILDEGKKLLLLNQSRGNLLINLETDIKTSIAGNEEYLSEINPSRNEGQECFVNLFQYPYQNVIKNKESLNAPPPRSAILSIDKAFSVLVWDEIPPEDMFNKKYQGIAYDQKKQLLYLSRDRELYTISEAGTPAQKIAEGVQPFVLHESSKRDLASFPLLSASILWKNNSYIFLGSENYLSYIDLTNSKYHTIQANEFNLSPKDLENTSYLFHNLVFLGESAQTPSSYWLVSSNKEILTGTNEKSSLLRDQIDAVVFFSLSEQGPLGYWQTSGQMYPEIWIKDLDGDRQAEILNYYCLSSFNCPEETRLNGRYLVWLDIVGKNSEGWYERTNESYPNLYRELWERLDLVKKEQESSKRNQQTYLCDEDLETLNNMLEESYRIASQ